MLDFTQSKMKIPQYNFETTFSKESGYWLGAYRSLEISKNKTFKWIDNSPFSLDKWANGEPNKHLRNDNFLHDWYFFNISDFTGLADGRSSLHLFVVCELIC